MLVRLAPEVISSIDGTVTVHATVLAGRAPAAAEAVELTVTYKDRNGMDHAIAPVDGTTDDAGAFEATIDGLTFDGTGTVTATVGGSTLSAAATFAVLDRTPPKVTITPPAMNQIRANQDAKITVTLSDEIGISQVFFEADANNGNGNFNRQRSTITTGATQLSVDFNLNANDNQVGEMITLHALAADLSGNLSAAQPVTLTVVP